MTKEINIGNGPFTKVGLGRLYKFEDGRVMTNVEKLAFKRQLDADGKEMPKYELEYNFQVNLPIDAILDSLDADKMRELAKHGLDEMARSYGASLAQASEEEVVAGFTEWASGGWAEKRQRAAAGPRTDSTETLAVKYVANVLKTKVADGSLASAKAAVPRADDPPKTEKGQINYVAWAKLVKEAQHPWYAVALKKVSTEKGFE